MKACKFISLLLLVVSSLLFLSASAQECDVGDFLKLCSTNPPTQECNFADIISAAGCGAQDIISIGSGWGATGPTLTLSGKTLYALNVTTPTFSPSVNIRFSGACNITQNLYLGGYAKVNITQGANVRVGGFVEVDPTATLEIDGNLTISESSQINGTIQFGNANGWLVTKSPIFLEGTEMQQAMVRGNGQIDGIVDIAGSVNFNYGSGSEGVILITQTMGIAAGASLAIAGNVTVANHIQISGSVIFPNIHDSIYNAQSNWLISRSSAISMSGVGSVASITGAGNIGGNMELNGLTQLNYASSFAVNALNITGNVTVQHSSILEMAGNITLKYQPIIFGTLVFPNKTNALTANLNAPSVAVWGAVNGTGTINGEVGFFGSVSVNQGNDGDSVTIAGLAYVPTTSTLLLGGSLHVQENVDIAGELMLSDMAFLASSVIYVSGDIMGSGYLYGSVEVNGTVGINYASPSETIVATNLTINSGAELQVGGIVSADSKVLVNGVLTLMSTPNYTASVSAVGIIVFDETSMVEGSGIINGPVQFNGVSSIHSGASVKFSHYQGITVSLNASLEILGNVTVSSGPAVIQGALKLTSTDSQSGLLIARSVMLGAYNGSVAIVTGTGAIEGNVSISGNATLESITITEDLQMTAAGALQLNIASANESKFMVGKTFNRAGSLYINLQNGFAPAENETIAFVTHSHASGAFFAILGDNTLGKDSATAVYADDSTSIKYSPQPPTKAPTPAPTSGSTRPPSGPTSPALSSGPSSEPSSPNPSTSGAETTTPLFLLGLCACFVSLL